MLPHGFERTYYSLLIGSVCYNGIHFWKRDKLPTDQVSIVAFHVTGGKV